MLHLSSIFTSFAGSSHANWFWLLLWKGFPWSAAICYWPSSWPFRPEIRILAKSFGMPCIMFFKRRVPSPRRCEPTRCGSSRAVDKLSGRNKKISFLVFFCLISFGLIFYYLNFCLCFNKLNLTLHLFRLLFAYRYRLSISLHLKFNMRFTFGRGEHKTTR